jgi:aldehyde dehydrogenase (NAD+)
MELSTEKDLAASNIKRAFDLQRANLSKLADSSTKERLEKLQRIDDYLKDQSNLEALEEAMHRDFRKPAFEVMSTEVGVVRSHLITIRRYLKRWMSSKRVATPLPLIGTSSYIHFEPKGLCLIIAPWNYPFNLAITPLLYAVAAGNAVVLKPSEISSHTSAFIHKMIEELFDESEIAVIEGDASVSKSLLELPFHHIFFTGSQQIGKIVMEAAAKNLASVTLELGGKSPAVIDPTANIKVFAGKIAWGKLINNGQTCIAPDYAIVHESILEDFVKYFQDAVKKMYDPEGKGVEHSPDLCRIVNARHFHRLKGLLGDAIEKGAKIPIGGRFIEDDLFIAPTLLTDVTEEMEIMQEEIFGPILPVLTYNRKEEIAAIINRRSKPLTMYIAGKDKKLAAYLIHETSAGSTVINDYMLGYSNPHLPFGGVNHSGIGKSMGYHGFVEFSNERSMIKRNWGTLKMIFPPFNSRKKRLIEFFYDLF